MNSAMPTVDVMGIECVYSLQYPHPWLYLRKLGTLGCLKPMVQSLFLRDVQVFLLSQSPSKLIQAFLPLCYFRP